MVMKGKNMISRESVYSNDPSIKDRVERCRARLELVLADHDCRLEAIVHITGKGVFPQIMILPRETNRPNIPDDKEQDRETC
jgi:hypothetical protein